MQRPGAVFIAWIAAASTLAGCAAGRIPPPPPAPLLFTADADLPLPRTLDESLKMLEHVLPADLQQEMRTSREQDMVRHHFSVGTWLRNAWLYGHGPRPLGQWFQDTHQVRDAENISGIVLVSFWRHLNDRPIDLEGQVRLLRQSYDEARVRYERRRHEAALAARAVAATGLGWTVEDRPAPVVTLPVRRTDAVSVRARYLARFRDGLLVTGTYFADSAPVAGQEEPFHTRCNFVTLDAGTVSAVAVAEADDVEDCVVVGDAAYFHGSRNGRPVIVRVTGATRDVLPSPPGDGWLRLAIGPSGLLVVRPHSISRYDGAAWQTIATTTVPLPRTGEPPREHAGRVWFRQEGSGGLPGRLAWLDLRAPSELRFFDQDIGWEALLARASDVVWRYDHAPTGEPWVLFEGGLAVASPEGYRMAVLHGRTTFTGEAPDPAAAPPGMPSALSRPTGVVFDDRGCATLATAMRFSSGAHLYRVCDGVVRPLLAFEGTAQVIPDAEGDYSWNWTPTHLVSLGAGRMVIGAEYGGLYLLVSESASRWRVTSLDEQRGPPASF